MTFYADPYSYDELTAVAALLDVRVRDRALMEEVIGRLRATVEVSDPTCGDPDLESALEQAEARRARATSDAITAALAASAEFFKTTEKPRRKRETPAQKRHKRWLAAYYRNNPTPAPPPTPDEEREARKIRLMINRATRNAKEGKIPEVETLSDRLI